MTKDEKEYWKTIYKKYRPKLIVDQFGYDGWCPICGHNFESMDDSVVYVHPLELSKNTQKERLKWIKRGVNMQESDSDTATELIACPPDWFREKIVFEDKDPDFDSNQVQKHNFPIIHKVESCPAQELHEWFTKAPIPKFLEFQLWLRTQFRFLFWVHILNALYVAAWWLKFRKRKE